jgi:hypothetical protein
MDLQWIRALAAAVSVCLKVGRSRSDLGQSWNEPRQDFARRSLRPCVMPGEWPGTAGYWQKKSIHEDAHFERIARARGIMFIDAPLLLIGPYGTLVY